MPDKVIHTPCGVTSIAFSAAHPNLLAAGMYDGTVCIFDIRKETSKPSVESGHTTGKHTDPVWQLQWVDHGPERGEALVSISSGMLLWMGFWDIIEMLIPNDAIWRLVMIGVGVAGLFLTRTLYSKSLLTEVRSHSSRAEHATTSMLSGQKDTELACADGSSASAAAARSRGICSSLLGASSVLCSDASRFFCSLAHCPAGRPEEMLPARNWS